MLAMRPAAFVLAVLAATQLNAGVATLDGNPDVFDTVVIGDFDGATLDFDSSINRFVVQGWEIKDMVGSNVNAAGQFEVGPGGFSGTVENDPQLILDLDESPLDVPDQVTIGSLPGQFDIVQFDFVITSFLDNANLTNTALRGDQFFLSGGPNALTQFYVNNGAGTGPNGTAPEMQVGTLNTYTIQRFSTDPAGWNETYGRIRIDPVNTSGMRFAIDNIILGRSNNVQPFTPFEPTPQSPVGDVNNDGVVDNADLLVAQDYLAGEGGTPAFDRQDILSNSGNSDAAVLAALNLEDFDLTDDDVFDGDDIAALQALVGLPGDFNDDGMVNSADYTVWRDNLNEVEDSQILAGNGNNDGTVDAADYLLWRENFGEPTSATAIGSPAVAPEPAAALLSFVVLSSCPCALRQRRR